MTETFLGNYRLLEKLGQGGMGTVYRAEHRRIPRRVALKVLSRELSANASVVDRFFTEARAAATIQHPSIVEIFDCDLVDEQAFIVMALLEGESLAQRLARSVASREPLPVAELVGVAQDIARGMSAAHAQGIVHRDLKPDNVFLHCPPGRTSVEVKILDFGIAKLATESGRHTTTGAVIGTPLYMSPEQCRGAGRVDWRSDIYSLGCILFTMTCGRPPFLREGSGELIVAHLLEEPPSLESARPGLPAGLQSLVSRLLAKAPEDRPQSMDEVVAALEGLRTSEQAAPVAAASANANANASANANANAHANALVPEVAPTRTEETVVRHSGEVSPVEGVPVVPAAAGERRRSGRPRRWWIAAVAGAVGTLGALGFFAASRGRPPEPVPAESAPGASAAPASAPSAALAPAPSREPIPVTPDQAPPAEAPAARPSEEAAGPSAVSRGESAEAAHARASSTSISTSAKPRKKAGPSTNVKTPSPPHPAAAVPSRAPSPHGSGDALAPIIKLRPLAPSTAAPPPAH